MGVVAVMAWAAPVMLGGIAAVALPVAAHLMHRRAARRVVFPSVMLLVEAKAAESRWWRLRRPVVLGLRCAAVTLVAMAFAQPVWRGSSAAEAGGRGMTVLVLDASASMMQRRAPGTPGISGGSGGGVTVFEALRARAGRFLEAAIAEGDAVNVVVASGRAEAVFAEATRSAAAVWAELGRVEPNGERADVAGAMALAEEMLSRHEGVRRVVVASDFQGTNWGGAWGEGRGAKIAALRLPSTPGDPAKGAWEGTDGFSAGSPGFRGAPRKVEVVGLEVPAAGNVGIVGVRPGVPGVPVVGQAIGLTVTVANFGDEEVTASVRVVVDGELPGAEVRIEAWETRDVRVEMVLERAGDRRVRVELTTPGTDALDADNAWSGVVRVVERRMVVVVSDKDAEDRGGGAYYLKRALEAGGEGATVVTVVRSDALDVAAVAECAAVFAGEVDGMPGRATEALRGVLERGGGVVVLGEGENVDEVLAALGGMESAPERAGRWRDVSGSGGLSIEDGDWRSAVLSAFDERSREALAGVRFGRVWEVPPEAGAEAFPGAEGRVLLKFGDGTPAMVERTVGRGRVVTTSFGVGPARSDLAKHGVFVALVQGLVDALGPAGDEGVTVGEPMVLRLPGAGETEVASTQAEREAAGLGVVGPGGEPVGVFDVAVDEDGAVVRLGRVTEAGFYEVRAGEEVLGVGAANLDARESDLRRMDEAAAATMLGGSNEVIVRGEDDALGNGERREEPLWGWVMAAALGMLALEMGILGAWRR